jgi:DHA2 family multidrug resistance protein
VLAIVLSPWVGRNVGRIDPRKLATFAFVGFAFVMWMRSRFDTQVPFEVVLLPIVLQGAAMAFFFIPLQSILFRGLTPEQMPGASGLSNFARICAGASAPRSSPRCGNAAPRCTTRTWPRRAQRQPARWR